MKKIGIKKINTSINQDEFVSQISGIIGNVKNVTFEGTFSNMRVYELNKGMIALLDFTDKTSTIPVLIIGNRDKEFKDFLENLLMRHTYRVQGNVRKVKEIDVELPFTNDLLNKSILCLTAIDDLKGIKLFNEDIVKLYNYDLDRAYEFVSQNTNYLKDITKSDIKDIMFSAFEDVIILLNDGNVYKNGIKQLDNIKKIVFISGLSIFAISNNNSIISLTGDEYYYDILNNQDYNYKKIIVTPLMIIGLTNEKDIKIFGTICDRTLDYHRFMNVDDIGYIKDNDDVVVVKDKKIYSLLCENEYNETNYEVLLDGKFEDIEII